MAVSRQVPFQGEWSTGVEVSTEAFPSAEPGQINIGLMLSAAGLYGVVSYLVAQSTREIGVRIALGASRARVARQVVAAGLLDDRGAVGVGVGLLGATLLQSAVAAMLYEVPADDPWALAGACVTLAAAAVIAEHRRAGRKFVNVHLCQEWAAPRRSR